MTADPASPFELDAEQLESVKAAHLEGGKKSTWEDFARKKKLASQSSASRPMKVR